MNGRWLASNAPVPHPFAFFLANGWDTTKPNRPFIRSAESRAFSGFRSRKICP